MDGTVMPDMGRPKRRRRVWVLRCALLLFAAVCIGLVLYVLSLATGRANARVDYLAMVNDLWRCDTADGNDARPYYEKAAWLYEELPRILSACYLSDEEDESRLPAFARTSQQYQKAIADYVEANRSTLAGMDDQLADISKDAFAKGLVPYVLGPEDDPLSWRLFEEACQHMRWVAAPDVNDGIEDPEYLMIMDDSDGFARTDSSSQDANAPTLSGKQVDLDSQGVLGKRLAAWGDAHKSREERTMAQRAVNLAVLAYWMEHRQMLDDPVLPNLYPFEIEAFERWVADNEPAWTAFVEGSRQAHYNRSYYCNPSAKRKWLLNASEGPLAEYRDLANLSLWKSQLDVRRGDIEAAIDDCLAVTRAGSHLMGGGTFIEQLVGNYMSRMGHNELLRIVRTTRLSAEQLDRALAALRALYPDGYPVLDWQFERLMWLDVIQNVFTAGGPGGGRIIGRELIDLDPELQGMPKLEGEVAAIRMAIPHARRNDTQAVAMKFFEDQIEHAKLTPFERVDANVTSGDAFLKSLDANRYLLLLYFLPGADRATQMMFRGRTLHEATLTVLALERWRLDRGSYPDGLKALVDAGLLDSLPMDPFSDGPLRYRLTEDGFVLYSFGHDLTDNGAATYYLSSGKPRRWSDEKGTDAVFWPVLKPRPEYAGKTVAIP